MENARDEIQMNNSTVSHPDPEAADVARVESSYALDRQIGFLLRQAQQRHTAIFARLMLDDVTPTQWATLAKLQEIGGCSQNLLGRHVAMDAATIKGVVDRLLARDLVVVAADPSDSRRLTIDLSEVLGPVMDVRAHHGVKCLWKKGCGPRSKQALFLDMHDVG